MKKIFFICLFVLNAFAVDLNIYTVKKNDTLSKIAEKFNISLKELIDINSISNINKIEIGDKILIPISTEEVGFASVMYSDDTIENNKKRFDSILSFLHKKEEQLKYRENMLKKLTDEEKIYFISEVNRMVNERFSEDQDFITRLIFAMIAVESSFNHTALGDKINGDYHSSGLLQINKNTVRFMQKKNNVNISDKELFNYLFNPLNNVEFALRVFEVKIETFNRIYKKLNKEKYKSFIKKHSLKHEEGLRDKYYRFFPVISMYNGGIKNYKYVDKVFKEVALIDK